MSEVMLVEFDPADIALFEPGRFDQMLIDDPQFASFLPQAEGLTAICGDDVIGCFFLRTVEGDPGAARPVLLASDEARRKYWLPIGLMARWGIARGAKNLGLTRLIAEAYHEFEAAHEWLRRLGFLEVGRDANLVKYERAV